MKGTMLSIRAGERAYQQIKEQGLQADDVKLLLGASGGPKWFVLQRLDRYLFGDWFAQRQTPLDTLGTSAGAWRFASLGQDDPVEASERFCQLYRTQEYSANPDRREITAEAVALLEKYVPQHAVNQILGQTAVRQHMIVARSRGWSAHEGRRQALELLAAASLNSVNRQWLKAFYQRVIFHHPASDCGFMRGWTEFNTQFVSLTHENFRSALLATGAIPLVLDGVKNIPGAPAGLYRDGGITDYHFDVDLSKVNGLVLYPHFSQQVVPGWFDKHLRWRRTYGERWPNVVLLTPTDEFLASLPYGKIPDRKDFAQLPVAERKRYWKQAVEQGQRLADEFAEAVESGTIRHRVEQWTA